jgi:hypothetical protein
MVVSENFFKKGVPTMKNSTKNVGKIVVLKWESQGGGGTI